MSGNMAKKRPVPTRFVTPVWSLACMTLSPHRLAPDDIAHLLVMNASELPVRCRTLSGVRMHKDPGQ